jgi:hypothetical protein
MEITEKGEFKVGNTKLSTPIMIRIPDYGYELPEIHSSSPIPLPMYTQVANIINWLERGIDVEFCNKRIDMERVFFFILEYNRFVKEENKKIDDIDRQYKLANIAQSRLYQRLNFDNVKEKRKADEDIPFKRKLFKNNLNKNNSNGIQSSYRNPYIDKQNKTKENLVLETINPHDSYAYDVFTPLQDMIQMESSLFNDVELTP